MIFSGNSFSLGFSSHLKIENRLIIKQFGILRLAQELTVNDIKEMRRYSYNDLLYRNYVSPSNDSLLQRAIKISSRLVQKKLRKSFLEFKEFTCLKRFSSMNEHISKIVNALSKIMQRNRVICQGKGFKDIISYKAMLEKND